MMENMLDTMQSSFFKWLEKSIFTIIGDIAIFAEGIYPLFVVVCLLGIYVSMAGDKEKGARMSSLSFLSYLIIRVMANVYK